MSQEDKERIRELERQVDSLIETCNAYQDSFEIQQDTFEKIKALLCWTVRKAHYDKPKK